MKPFRSALPLAALLLAAPLAAAAPAASTQLYGHFFFIDDQGHVLIDLGSENDGWQKFSVRLAGVKPRDGLADAAAKVVPLGSLVRVQWVKPGVLPEVTIWLGTRNLNQALMKK